MNSDFRVGPWLVKPDLNTISRNGISVQVEPKVMDVLVCLAEHPGEVLPKETILQTVWPDTYVTDDVLRHSVSILRHTFGDDARNPQIIETIPKRGYRLVAPVETLDGARHFGPTKAQDAATAAVESGGRGKLAAAVAFTSLLLAAVTALLWTRGPARPTGRSEWVQVTNLPDAVSQPALSPDGRMVAFIRGPETFMTPGQVYVKVLPDGEPVQLTDDRTEKMSPVFSLDGSQIAYTSREEIRKWDTWEVGVNGRRPHLWLHNASGLTWIAKGAVLFSEHKKSVHMGIVAAAENRASERDVYLPPGESGMAHRSYASPDRKWVLVVEMDKGSWLPCRLVPIDGSSPGRQVGPHGASCTSAAWSPDGKWMYFTANAGGVFHIWRQRFPGGRTEQITSGPTEEEGTAVAPDGRSFITSVGLSESAVWLHDNSGERQISLEGYSYNPKFSPDGRSLYFVRDALSGLGPGQLWKTDLPSGRRELLLPTFGEDPGLAYDVSPDGRWIVVSGMDNMGKNRLWVADTRRRSPPRQIPGIEGDEPFFGADGEIFFHVSEWAAGRADSVGRVSVDGTGLQTMLEKDVPALEGISPDRRWLLLSRLHGNEIILEAFPVGGGSSIPILSNEIDSGWVNWSYDGRMIFIMLAASFGSVPAGHTYVVPLRPGTMFPQIPPGGFRSEDEIAKLPGVRLVDSVEVAPGPTPEIYAYTRQSVQRNLYRVPLP